MATPDEVTVEELRTSIDSRLSGLASVRPTRLNVSAWICADSQWIRSLDKAGVLEIREAAALLEGYIRERDRRLFAARQISSQATWSRHHPFAVRKLAAVETFWQFAGFLTSWRFRTRHWHSPGSISAI